MTHATRGLKTVKTAAPLVLHPPSLAFTVSLFHHYLMLSSIHVIPSRPSEALSLWRTAAMEGQR